MLLARQLYWISVSFTLLFFFLFIRLFVWKLKAERDHWSKRPNLTMAGLQHLAWQKRRLLPYITLMVPARNEAAVIGRTIDHLCQINYPADRYEIIIVSDEKEILARDQAKDKLITLLKVSSKGEGELLTPENLKIEGFSRLLLVFLCQKLLSNREALCTLPEPLLGKNALFHNDELQTMIALLCETERFNPERAEILLERYCYHETEETRLAMLPVLLILSLAVRHSIAVLKNPAKKISRAELNSFLRTRPAASRSALEEWYTRMSNSLRQACRELNHDPRWEMKLRSLYDQAYPTTQSIVRDKQNLLKQNGSRHRLRHIVTPYDFDGIYQGDCLGYAVPSTKGRALNYALPRVTLQTEMIGFYDAESRPETDLLLYVAWRRIQEGNSLKILQGPVFQVRNFYEMGPLSKLAGLYQSLAHDWYLPILFDQIPFLGGTNVFIDHQLMQELKGFDHQVLTEDLELGARAWLQCRAWPEYLPYYSSEQTPPTVKGYFRQRLRWGAGHLQVMEKLRSSPEYRQSRTSAIYWRLFVKGQMEWFFYQLGSLIPLGVFLVQWIAQIEPEIPPPQLTTFFNLLTVVYLGFSFYAYARYLPVIDRSSRPRSLKGQFYVWGSLFTLPLASFFFIVPYSAAWLRKRLHREQRLWEKTPRSQE